MTNWNHMANDVTKWEKFVGQIHAKEFFLFIFRAFEVASHDADNPGHGGVGEGGGAKGAN